MSEETNLPEGIIIPPFKPVNGRVTVQPVPYKPSRTVEIFTIDKADENEGYVVALSDCKYGRKYDKKKGWEHNAIIMNHDVKVGDRVLFPGSYQDEGVHRFNGVKYRTIDPWDIVGIIQAERPEGFENASTGEKTSEIHPLLIH